MWVCTLRKKVTINQVITMLATSKNVLFPGHNHLLTTGADDPSVTWWIVAFGGSGITPDKGHITHLVCYGLLLSLVSMTSTKYLPWVQSLSKSLHINQPDRLHCLLMMLVSRYHCRLMTTSLQLDGVKRVWGREGRQKSSSPAPIPEKAENTALVSRFMRCSDVSEPNLNLNMKSELP